MSKWGSTISDRMDVAVNDASLSKRITALENSAATTNTGSSGGGVGTAQATPCTPTFAIGYERLKKGLRATFCASIPNDTDSLTTVIIRQSDRTNTTTFNQGLIKYAYTQIDDAARAAQHLEYRFAPRLEYGTTYDLVRLKAFNASGASSVYPTADPVFNTAPITSFTTPEQFGVPSNPSSSLLLKNELDPTTKEYDARTLHRVYAPLDDSGAAQTWQAAGAEQVIVVLQRTGDTNLIKFSHQLDSTELTQVDNTALSSPVGRGYVDIPGLGLVPGAQYTWTRNIAWCNGEKRGSTGGSFAFQAGGFQTDPNALLNVALTPSASEPFDGRRILITLTADQPTTPVALKRAHLERKLSTEADSAYNDAAGDDSYHVLRDDQWNTPSAHIVQTWSVVVKPAKTYIFRCTIKAFGGTRVVTTAPFTPGDVILPAKNNALTDTNIAFNGGFFLSLNDTVAGNAEILASNWRDFPQTGNRIDTTAGPTNTFAVSGVGWVKSDHRLRCSTTINTTPSVKVRKNIVPGETYTLTFLVSAATSYTSTIFGVDLYDNGNAANIVTLTFPSFTITTSYQEMVAVFVVPGTYVVGGSQWLRFRPNVIFNTGASETYIDKVMLVRGQMAMPWAPSPDEVDFDTSITGFHDTGVGIATAGGGHNSSTDGTEFRGVGAAGILVGANTY